jgi:phenylpropionate dioxygenase-like ring-hydroxylating dioxygenase large terminal subunit
MTSSQQLLSDEEISSIRAPIESARTFPRRAFTSSQFFDAELSKVFHNTWAALCPAGDLSAPGDVVPVDAFGVPLVAIHGNDGRIRVFHNICAYDGHPIALERQRGVDRLTVTYHGWCYDLTGALVEAPFWGGNPKSGIDAVPAEHRKLVEVPSGVALGMVFINLSGQSGTLEQHLAPLVELLAEYDLDDLEAAHDAGGNVESFTDEVRTNWKTFVENDCLNILHEGHTHALYRASPEVPRVDQDGQPLFEVVDTGDVLGFGYLEKNVLATYPKLDFPHIGRSGRPERGYFLQLYPNVSMAVMPTVLTPGFTLPVAPDRTLVGGLTLLRKGAAGPESSATRKMLAEGFAGAAIEDGAVVEAVQRNRRSPVHEQNFYSPFWDQPHYRFTNRVLRDLLAD